MEARRMLRVLASCCLIALALAAPLAAAQSQQLAPQPATTRTTMAEQVLQLQNAPALYNIAAMAPAPALAVSQFQQTSQAATQQAAPAAQTTTQQQSTAQQAGPGRLPPLPQQPGAMGPVAQPNAQSAFNMLGSAVQAAGSVGNAGQALTNAAAAAGSGDLLQTVGSAAQAFQAVQQAATAVGTAQKTIQSGGAEAPTAAVASGGQQQQQGQQQYASPAPPTININVPGLGGNAQGPPGLTYTQGSQGNGAASQGYQGAQQGYQGSTAQGYSQGNGQAYGAIQGTGTPSAYGASQNTGAASSTTGSDPLQAIGSALAQAAFGGGLNQPAAGNTATLQSKNNLGRKMS